MKMRTNKKCWLACFLGLASCLVVAQPQAQDGPVLLSDTAADAEPYVIPPEYLADAEALQPLPRDWFLFWYADASLTATEANWPYLIRLAEVFGTFGTRYWHSEAEMLRAKAIAEAAGVPLTVTIMPWHIRGCFPDPDNWDETLNELTLIREYLQRIKAPPLELNVGAFLVDSECYQEADPRVTTRLNMVYDLIGSESPGVKQHWFANGHRPEMADARCDVWTVACYAAYDASQFEGFFLQNRSEHPDADWGIWFSGDSGYWRGSWEQVLGRDPIEYWMIGRMLRVLYDLGVNEYVYVYPFLRPNAPTWHQSLMAVARGAMGMQLVD